MPRRPYRVEVSYPTNGNPRYYLVKDVTHKGKRRKVRKYLRSGTPPTHDDVERYRRDYAHDLEMKAVRKKAEMSSDGFRSDILDREQLAKLESLRFMNIRFHELMTTSEIERYEEDFEDHYVQGTTSIEGNTLTLEQASDLLRYGLLPSGRTLREINEVQNFKGVISYRNRYRGEVTIGFIRELHALVMRNIDDESAGTFRRTDLVAIAGSDIRLTPYAVIEDELELAIQEYYGSIGNEGHPFEAAIMFHYGFETIHPFTDGNGRVGREVLNYMLMRSNFPRLLFLGRDRQLYLDALRKGNRGDLPGMIETFYDLIISQRYAIMEARLGEMVTPIERAGQLNLWDFVDINR